MTKKRAKRRSGDDTSSSTPPSPERGFTLLEILLALIVLAVAGVSVISLFAAAVSLQYESVVYERQSRILPDLVSEAQRELDAFTPTEEEKMPPGIERKPVAQYPRDFEFEVGFVPAPGLGIGEGAIATISVYYRGRALDPVVRVLQRTTFTKAQLRESVSYKRDRQADEAGGRAEKDPGKDEKPR